MPDASSFCCRAHPNCKGGLMQVAVFGRALPAHPWACCWPVAIGALLDSGHVCPSRTAPAGSAAPPFEAWGAMRRRTITISDPQQRHCSLGRSLNGGCVDGCADGCMPAGPGTIAPGLRPMRNSANRWRCLQLGWSKPKLRERRNPLGKTCCNTSHKKCAPVTVRVVFLPMLLSR